MIRQNIILCLQLCTILILLCNAEASYKSGATSPAYYGSIPRSQYREPIYPRASYMSKSPSYPPSSYGQPPAYPPSNSYPPPQPSYKPPPPPSYGESSPYQSSGYDKGYEKPMPYSFGYDINDGYGNSNFQKEQGDDYGVKKGSYGYTDAYGIYRQVDYVADSYGFHATVKTNEPGTAPQAPADVQWYAKEPPAQAYGSSGYGQQQSYGKGGGYSSGGPSSYPAQSSYQPSYAPKAVARYPQPASNYEYPPQRPRPYRPY